MWSDTHLSKRSIKLYHINILFLEEKNKKQKKQLKNKDMPHLVVKDALKIC